MAIENIYIRMDLDEAQSTGTVPIREWDLIEFYKKVQAKHNIVAVEFDVDNHSVSFVVCDERR